MLPGGSRPAVWITDALFWLAVGGWVALGISWFFAPASRTLLLPLSSAPLDLPAILGLAIALAGLWCIIAGIRALGRWFRTSIDYGERTHLVTGGPYRYMRNPMALGLILQGWGSALLHQSWAAISIAVLLHATNRLRIHFEEGRLVALLGEEYVAWTRRTGRFLPRLRR
jgi:protein-S-isoprenylcysteine O-methyltransferase Ste14